MASNLLKFGAVGTTVAATGAGTNPVSWVAGATVAIAQLFSGLFGKGPGGHAGPNQAAIEGWLAADLDRLKKSWAENPDGFLNRVRELETRLSVWEDSLAYRKAQGEYGTLVLFLQRYGSNPTGSAMSVSGTTPGSTSSFLPIVVIAGVLLLVLVFK